VGGATRRGQGVQPDRPEIPMATAETGFDDEVEPDLVERLTAKAIVEAAQRDRGLVRVAREVLVE
jgi:hypothetical protein